MRGQGEPSCRTAGKGGVVSVHGQPNRPSGGGGRSARVGELKASLAPKDASLRQTHSPDAQVARHSGGTA